MNKAILMGRITADPELRQTANGTACTSFTIAVDRRRSKDGLKETDFIRCTAWRQRAEFICKYFTKGSMILIVGNIQTRSWDDPNGKKQYATDILVDETYFTGEKREQTAGGNNNSSDNTYSNFEDLAPGDFVNLDDMPF